MALLESVPNISEGRNPQVIEAIADAFAVRARVLDIHSDQDHHRSVYTLVGEQNDLAAALFAGIVRATELIDLREHAGIHPRVGAADVVPIVPLAADQMGDARQVATALGERVGGELGLPVFLYGASADGLRPAFFRRGGPAELQRRLESGELQPSFGPPRLDPRAGAVLIGARPPLIAFNIVLVDGELEDARAIAAAVRASNGGMPGVQALGLLLPAAGKVQVSINVIDTERAALIDVVECVREAAAERGVELGRSELVGLLPEGAVADPAALGLDTLTDVHVLERRLAGGRGGPLQDGPTHIDPPGHAPAMEITADEARRRLPELTALLVDAVDGGASNGFLRPLTPEEAGAYWEGRLGDVEAGRSILLAAIGAQGTIVGIVMVDLAGQPNGHHRAEVTKLIVHSAARRQGLGAGLLREAERVARARGRWLLVLDTVPGSDADRLYRRHGWTEVGVIPDFAFLPDGEPAPTVVFFKRLA